MKLSQEQQALLDDLREAKRLFDADAEYLKRQYHDALNVSKNPIRQLAAHAVEAGIPMRQIYRTGLGFEQVNSLRNFLEEKSKTAGREITDLLVPVESSLGAPGSLVEEIRGHFWEQDLPSAGPKKASLVDLGKDKWRYTRADGTEFFVNFIAAAGILGYAGGDNWEEGLEEEVFQLKPEWEAIHERVRGIDFFADLDDEEDD